MKFVKVCALVGAICVALFGVWAVAACTACHRNTPEEFWAAVWAWGGPIAFGVLGLGGMFGGLIGAMSAGFWLSNDK